MAWISVAHDRQREIQIKKCVCNGRSSGQARVTRLTNVLVLRSCGFRWNMAAYVSMSNFVLHTFCVRKSHLKKPRCFFPHLSPETVTLLNFCHSERCFIFSVNNVACRLLCWVSNFESRRQCQVRRMFFLFRRFLLLFCVVFFLWKLCSWAIAVCNLDIPSTCVGSVR